MTPIRYLAGVKVRIEQLLEQVQRCLRLSDRYASTFASRVRRCVSRIQAKSDSRVRLMIGFVQHRPGLFFVALGFRASSDPAIIYVYAEGMRWPCCAFSA
jgi:hypothetical protein